MVLVCMACEHSFGGSNASLGVGDLLGGLRTGQSSYTRLRFVPGKR